VQFDVSALGTILGIWAHPDDEAYLMAGVMALAADQGQHVACVTATLGDAGETADEARWPRADLTSIRRAELDRCLRILGVTDHLDLGLQDGTLADLDPAEPIAELVAAMERVSPDTVITFGPDGMTGHPDHRTISRWTSDALARSDVDATVLWASKTREWVAAFPEINAEVFPDTPPPTVPADEAVVITLDDTTLARKVRALEAHASQTTGLLDAFGRDRYGEWVRDEVFEIADTPQ
jgi:LmbE family N-acetylglucosaminyl deacetylase